MGGGSDDEITAMLSLHYAGDINIPDYWAVGDIRRVSLSAAVYNYSKWSSYGCQDAQDIDLVIIGMNHDTLYKTNGTRTTAVMTVQTKNCLATKGYMNWDNNDASCALWSTSERRTLCNDDFKNTLPTYIYNLIKPVNKLSNRYCYTNYSDYASYRTQETTVDDCFLLSEYEVFGVNQLNSVNGWGTLSADGVQYEYMKTKSNRIKYLGINGTDGIYWWTRTSDVYQFSSTTSAYFICCIYNGNQSDAAGGAEYGIAPAFCL